jgi:hypothetical protein
MIRVRRMTLTPALRVAAACAAIALITDAALLVRAVRPWREPVVVPLRIVAATPIVSRKADSRALLDSAQSSEAFEPLGGAQTLASSGTVIPQAAPMPAAQPRLIGTVVDGARSFVMMALTDGTMKVVRVGERAGDLKLRAVSAGGAVFDDIHGDRVTLKSPTPGSEPQP